MLIPKRRAMEFLSISALDLFASALGIFVLMAILLFPFYLRQPSLEIELAGAEAELAASGESLLEAERTAESEAERKATALAALAQAQERLQQAQTAAASAAEALEQSLAEAAASEDDQTASQRRMTPLSINDLDLVFVMDTTGSMRSELADVQANLLGVIRVLHRLAPSLRVGFVAFKDRGAAYVTRSFPLRPMTDVNVREVIRFVGQMSAQGGGDDPEPVDEALAVATAMPWRAGAQGRIIVIGDAPARPSGYQRTLQLAREFRASAPDPALPRTISAIYTGPPSSVRQFFEQIATAGGGDFSAYQGQIIENVLLSVLHDPDGGVER
ncbi:MAG: vWA domain-containing protein [Pseudomonadota bacterium]